ncbi:hypothetical protein H696_02105 [Fonticula alba]|uniref:MC family mitochondrial carrier protein n=1 Tax=Fonticula alba TaxID=691883 RepID=A0A058ZA75_FONAL|nr:hypothetical protein H696_02105 [Fonticula alba]KCV71155.1 hypothetical protein H696_02105 [Fonticula alba]|eukprot:XP_009494278.1 hypothetical protein H696_02105 [Fonticula alba]
MASENAPAPRRTLTALQSGIVGAFAGTTEVLINQPFVGWKNAVQQSTKIDWRPNFLYRGVVINSASIAPITAVQFGVNGFLTPILRGNKAEASSGDRLLAALVAGGASAVVSTPAELVMIQQQNTGKALFETAKIVMREHGARIFYKGLVPTAVRESVFTCGYLGLAPVLNEMLLKTTLGNSDPGRLTALVTASIVAGQIAAFVTQPFDSVKTRMQGDIGAVGRPARYTTLAKSFSLMTKELGVRGLYAGIIPRGLRMVSAVFVFQIFGRLYEDLLFPQ